MEEGKNKGTRQRIILLVDMDYFFAQIEEVRDPSIKGKPVIVGADPKSGKGRGVASTCNYIARKFGIHSGMPISIAYSRCPNAVFLPVNFELYDAVSRRIMRILSGHAMKFEQVSVDEAYLELTGKAKDFVEARKTGEQIKKDILEKEHLTCSVGIASNKLVAKIAAGQNKPNGLTVVLPEQNGLFLAPLPIGKLPGIGKKTEPRMKGLGINTIGDLAKKSASFLREQFGSFGAYYYFASRGIDNSELVESWEAKSISRNITFEKDTSDSGIIIPALKELCNSVFEEASNEGFLFRTITLKIRFTGFEDHTKQKTMKRAVIGRELLESGAIELLKQFLLKGKKIRLVGIGISGLEKKKKTKTLMDFSG